MNIFSFKIFRNGFPSLKKVFFKLLFVYFVFIIALVILFYGLKFVSRSYFILSFYKHISVQVTTQNFKTDKTLKNAKKFYSNQKVTPWHFFELYKTKYLTNDWQKVRDSKNLFYLYSAYYDDRLKYPYIRIIALTKTKNYEKVKCKLWYSNIKKPESIFCNKILIRENWNLKYSAFFLLCPLGYLPIPDAVSVYIYDSFQISNYLIVKNKPNSRINLSQNSIALCVKPMHYNYNKVANLIEFIEFNQILGVSHFLFYNHSIGKEVNCLLKHYINTGLVTVLPWNYDGIKSQKEIRTEGLLASLNDCIYRTMYKFKYLIMTDFDEFIIPYVHSNLLALIQSLFKNETSALSFRNVFFYLQWPDDPEFSSQNYKVRLITLAKTKRKLKISDRDTRSKLILKPSSIIEIGNHCVWEAIKGKWTKLVDYKIALLHHYRICEFGGNDCINTFSTISRRTFFWKNKLIAAVNRTMQRVNLTCKL